MSSRLTHESRVYADKAKDLNRQALIKKWAPVGIVLGIVFVLTCFISESRFGDSVTCVITASLSSAMVVASFPDFSFQKHFGDLHLHWPLHTPCIC